MGEKGELGAGGRKTDAWPSVPNPPTSSNERSLGAAFSLDSVFPGHRDHKHGAYKASTSLMCLSQNHLRLLSVPSENRLSCQASNDSNRPVIQGELSANFLSV